MCASDVFIREQTWHRESDSIEDVAILSTSNELDTLIGALKLLGNTFPLARMFFIKFSVSYIFKYVKFSVYQAEKVEQSRPTGYASDLLPVMMSSPFSLPELQNQPLL